MGFLETIESARAFLERNGRVSLRAPLPAALGVPQSWPERLRETGRREAEMGARFCADRGARELAW